MPTYNVTKYDYLLIIIVLVWGLSWPVNKIALQFVPPIWFAALRLIVGFFSFSLVVIFVKKWKFPRRRDLPIILTVGLLQVGLFMALINVGLIYVDAGRSAILVYTTPIWVMPLTILFFKEKINYLKWIGFCLGMFGVVILFNPHAFSWADHSAVLGNGILLLASLCWAISILCARHMKWHRTPFELLPWQLIVGVIAVVLIAMFLQPHPQIQWNMTVVTTLAYTGIIATGFAYWGIIVISKELPSVTVSLSLLGVPVSALAFSVILLDEKISLSILIAMMSIVMGLVFVALGGRKQSGIIDKMD